MEIQNHSDYLIYPSGKVFSKKRTIMKTNGRKQSFGGKYLKHHLSSHGYPMVRMNQKSHNVHRLLAVHYIENPDNKPEVDHIDRDKTNHKLNNLRWVTRSENGQNTSVRCDNKLCIKNISFVKKRNKYQYQKSINSINHRKMFNTLDEAIAYKKSYESKLIL